VKAESIKLWLPSQLDAEDRDSICLGGVINSEKELRFAQLEDSLNDLRRARRIRHGLITFHKVQLAGQGQKTQTKSQAVMQTIQDRIVGVSDATVWLATHSFAWTHDGDWQNLYLPLTDDDNRGPGKEPEECWVLMANTPSWIWRSGTTAVSPDEVNEDMRVEWAQCVARADRWEEEVILLQEEMRRVVQFLEWRSRDWLAKVDSRIGTATPAVCSGLSAYANKQGVGLPQPRRSVLPTLALSAHIPFPPSCLGHRVLGDAQGTTRQSGLQETQDVVVTLLIAHVEKKDCTIGIAPRYIHGLSGDNKCRR
jgi:hypothetical protein